MKRDIKAAPRWTEEVLRQRAQSRRVNMEEFAERLRCLREKRKLSRRTLAELCGISKSTLCRLERGERVPDLLTAAILAEFFCVSIDYLAGK